MGSISDSHSSSSPSPRSNSRSSVPPTFSTRIFSDVAGDITVVVDGESFLLHKFPLVARCGKMRKMVRDLKDSSSSSHLSRIELRDFPGGPLTFELAMKFCYGINFEITASNVVALRCAAGYLDMSEDYKEENLIARAENYLEQIAFRSLQKSVQVLCSCEMMQEMAETFKIPDRCVEAIAMNAYREQLVSSLSEELKGRNCLDSIEELSVLGIHYYSRVVSVMARTGVRSESIVASLMHYAQESLKSIIIRNCQEQREIVEAIVTLLPNDEKGSSSLSIIPLSFLFGMLKVGITIDIEISCKLEVERRISHQLETVSLDDLLIPSVQTDDSMYDVDTVQRILTCFLERIDEEDEDSGYESDSTGRHHGSLLQVGRIMDAYLAEIAPDPYLSLHKFTSIIETLPEYSRIIDDGIYRAIDMYLKAHPSLTEEECKKLCNFIDCNRLSQEASNHVAQNDRLPVQMVVRVLYSEQLRLKKALSGDSEEGLLVLSSGVQSRAASPGDTYASLRRENRELKLEIARMRVRVSELEKEQMLMKEGMMEKTGNNGETFLTSLSKGIGRIAIFGGENKRKVNRKPKSVSEIKPSRMGR